MATKRSWVCGGLYTFFYDSGHSLSNGKDQSFTAKNSLPNIIMQKFT